MNSQKSMRTDSGRILPIWDQDWDGVQIKKRIHGNFSMWYDMIRCLK